MSWIHKGRNLQKSCTSASLEAYPKRSDSVDERNHVDIDDNSITYLQPEREEVVMWVWNNIITRDKMRRKSVAGVPTIRTFKQAATKWLHLTLSLWYWYSVEDNPVEDISVDVISVEDISVEDNPVEDVS